MKTLHKLWKFIDEEIEIHLNKIQLHQPASNFIDAYLLERYDEKSRQFSFDRKIFFFFCNFKLGNMSLEKCFASLLYTFF